MKRLAITVVTLAVAVLLATARAITVATLAVAALLATAAYVPRPPDHDPQAVQWLKDHPGGTLTGKAELTYTRSDGLPIMVTFDQSTGGKPDCPVNTLCLYAGPSYRYPRAATEACGYLDLRETGWARHVRSIHNNLPSGDHKAGTVDFIRSDGAPPSDANQYKVLILDPASRTADNTPAIDYLYHRC